MNNPRIITDTSGQVIFYCFEKSQDKVKINSKYFCENESTKLVFFIFDFFFF